MTLNIYPSIYDFSTSNKTVFTLGTFDGVHLGHQSILSHLKNTAQKIGGETVVFTFHPHPRIALNPDDHGLEMIQELEDRIKKLEASGIDHLILFPFTKEFSRYSGSVEVKYLYHKGSALVQEKILNNGILKSDADIEDSIQAFLA